MQYTMKSGILYGETPNEGLAKIKSAVAGFTKMICKTNDTLVLKAEIRHSGAQGEQCRDISGKEYILSDCGGTIVAVGRPGYEAGDGPDIVNGPVSRLPHVDHARVIIDKSEYLLTMHNSQNYSLRAANGAELLRIMHKGITGGWNIVDDHGFAPEILCGIFVFCRYIEQENEFLIV